MHLNDYQDLTAQFAIYPERGTGSTAELAYLTLGLGGETGEVLEKVKKYIRDGTFVRADVAKEMGDVLWYLARLANAIGYDLDMIAKLNISKLSDRQKRNVLQGSGDER